MHVGAIANGGPVCIATSEYRPQRARMLRAHVTPELRRRQGIRGCLRVRADGVVPAVGELVGERSAERTAARTERGGIL